MVAGASRGSSKCFYVRRRRRVDANTLRMVMIAGMSGEEKNETSVLSRVRRCVFSDDKLSARGFIDLGLAYVGKVVTDKYILEDRIGFFGAV